MAAGRFLPVVLLATLAALSPPRSAAQQSAPPTFRSNIDVVRVDTIVTDHDGRPIVAGDTDDARTHVAIRVRG